MKDLMFLFVLAVLLVACTETDVVKLTNNKAASPQATTQTTTASAATTGAVVNTNGKVPIKCDDLDLDDPDTIGRVTVTYSDNSTQNFYDYCPTPTVNTKTSNDLIEIEYICVGNEVKTKNHVCAKFKTCTMMNVKADPGKKVGACL